MVKLLDETIYFVDVRAAALRDALTATVVEHLRIATFVGRHALDDGFHTFEGVVVDIHVLQSLAHTGYHRGQVFDVAHLFDLTNLGEEVFEVKFVLLNFLLQLTSFGLVVLFLGALYKADDVAHAQYAVGHALGVEHIEGFHLFARA